MRITPAITAAFLFSALLADGCSSTHGPDPDWQAQTPSPLPPTPPTESLRLKDGTTLKGHVSAYDTETKLVIFHTLNGKDVYFQLSDLDSQSAYKLMQGMTSKDDATGQVQLGNQARDAGLYFNAALHYGNAEKADPATRAEVEKERALLRQKAAEFALNNARTAIRHDELHEAKKWLTRIVEKLPDEPQASEAAKLLDGLFMRDRLELDLPIPYNAPSALADSLGPAKGNYVEMLQKTQDGLTIRNAGTESTVAWERGLYAGAEGLREIDGLEKRFPDPVSRGVLIGYRELFIAQIVELHLHLASVWTTRSSYHKAMEQVEQALVLDPHNLDALAARAHVKQATANDSGWWY